MFSYLVFSEFKDYQSVFIPCTSYSTIYTIKGSTGSKITALVTGRNEVLAKVMFLQVCVCPQWGRVSASVHAGIPDPPPPWDQADPLGPGRPPPAPGRPPQTRQTPPGSRLQHTVYERPVRILLECIPVIQMSAYVLN